MNDAACDLSDDGISFIVTVGNSRHKCLITHDALQALCPDDDEDIQAKAIFWEYEDRIYRVAQRAVKAGESSHPLVIGPQHFS